MQACRHPKIEHEENNPGHWWVVLKSVSWVGSYALVLQDVAGQRGKIGERCRRLLFWVTSRECTVENFGPRKPTSWKDLTKTIGPVLCLNVPLTGTRKQKWWHVGYSASLSNRYFGSRRGVRGASLQQSYRAKSTLTSGLRGLRSIILHWDAPNQWERCWQNCPVLC